MEKKIILQIARLYKPHIGGVEKHVGILSSMLLKSGFRVILITELFDKSLPKHELVDGVEVHRINYPRVKYFGIIFLWFKLLSYIKLIINSELIHIHDVYVWYLPYRVLFFWKKSFLTIHGWEGKYPISKASLFQKRIASKLSKKTLLIGAYLKKLYGLKSNNVLYGFIDSADISKKVAKKRLIVFLGRLEKDTGIELLLEYLGKSRSRNKFDVVFCGDGQFRAECEKYGKVTGFIDPKKYIGDAEFLIASGYLSVFEGLKYRCKVVVIASSRVRRLIFKNTPFNKYVSICANNSDFDKAFSKVKYDVELGYEWAKKHDSEYLYSKYARMWGINQN